jgi:hypothetical protein
MHQVRIRDVVRHHELDLGPETRVLRVPYDLFQPSGAVRFEAGRIEYVQSGERRTGRVVDALLGDVKPGERVLVHLDRSFDGDWWLCEIESVDDVVGTE